ncbi:DNA (cytosine-5)-methyltransferase 1 [Streptomyces olivoverticillatus]|uniref:Cytosine-specific methyltransferase n=1 Tax=Streptomyces olivoverticillatus TaxID=66427 RepID=A0A7W7LQ00_9ACTN|nr:DNA (cytosine-5)-methyltransferase 1 [Streptomyces olivoverticillatus]
MLVNGRVVPQTEPLTSIEICAGAGGQAVGLHQAGFKHLALVEIDKHACKTLEENLKVDAEWGECEVLDEDVNEFKPHRSMKQLGGRALEPGELDLLAGGVPCPPFSVAGKQLGRDDERDLFPRMLKLVELLKPKAVMIENVRGIMDLKFRGYREEVIMADLKKHGYRICEWDLLQAQDFGVPQLRPRAILVAIRNNVAAQAELNGVEFEWPGHASVQTVSVVKALQPSMEERRDRLKKDFPDLAQEVGEAYDRWLKKATEAGGVAPTLVGGSKKHGGADLGPSRAKAAWKALGVNALGVANDMHRCEDPGRDFLRDEGPMLTVDQAAIIQGFPDGWQFVGGKTARYRQVGNAFPPPVAKAVGLAIAKVLLAARDPQSGEAELTAPSVPAARSASDAELSASIADSSIDRERTTVG